MAAEMLLQYLWEHRLWRYDDMSTTDGHRVRVIDPGMRNNDSGPDFFNAKVEIGGKLWAGNVEVHVKSSDWVRHRHHIDKSYDSVVLHVVGDADAEVYRTDGSKIPQTVLSYAPDYAERYNNLVNNTRTQPACMEELAGIHQLYLTDWLSSLGFERLYEKVDRIMSTFKRLDGDWEATAYVTLARALGFGVNSEPFERLAMQTPLHALMKHRDEPLLVEAALYGQAGLLDDVSVDEEDDRLYVERLRMDYAFLKAKYGLRGLSGSEWKTGRMRPPNFPHRRIATLCAMICSGFSFGRNFVHITDVDAARNLLSSAVRGYWMTHYDFGKTFARNPTALSSDSLCLLMINAVAPLLYSYGLYFGDSRMEERAVGLLEGLPAENNSIIRQFRDAGIVCEDGFTSQALIQLRRGYCEPRKCLYCRIGHRILAAKARP